MMPPTIFVDAREAVQMTRERFACGAEQAAAYLEDQIAAGEIEPDWSEGKPDPGGAFDWFQGVVWRTSTLQDRAIGAGPDPTFRAHRRTWPFRLRRQQLADRLITAAVATIVDQQTHTRPRPVLSEVITDMRGYIAEHDGVDLREIPRKELEHMFGVSRDSVRRALREIYLDAD
jgi:hypothetical protein